jgi:hypothetical protein
MCIEAASVGGLPLARQSQQKYRDADRERGHRKVFQRFGQSVRGEAVRHSGHPIFHVLQHQHHLSAINSCVVSAPG